MRTVWQDLRFALRILAKSPGFTVTAVISLALGIGINTLVFSLINAVNFKPVPGIKEPDRLVWFRAPASYPDYEDFRERNEVFAGITALSGENTISLSSGGQSEIVKGEFVSANYFSVLGVAAALGRTFLPEEDRAADAAPVVVLSHALWQRRFGSDPYLTDKTVNLNGLSFTVVGIAPAGFVGAETTAPRDLWLPMMTYPRLNPPPAVKGDSTPEPLRNRSTFWLSLIARLNPGVTRVQAETAIKAIAGRVAEEHHPQKVDERLRAVELVTASGAVDPRDRTETLSLSALLLAVASLVLLTACANIAGLLLARASLRRREIGIRQALGASRTRLVQQLLTESSVLSLLGGAAGLLLAVWGKDLLSSFIRSTPIASLDLSLDYRVFAFTLLACLLTGVIFGLIPALQATKPDLVPALKDEARAFGNSYRRSRLRNAFVVAQTALSVVLLIGSGLFIRSLQSARSINPGFAVDNGLLTTVDLALLRYDQSRGQEFFRQMIERVQGLPGVEQASLTKFLPLGLRLAQRNISGEALVSQQSVSTGYNIVAPRYFQTMGISMVRGREFTVQDRMEAPRVVVINETLARRLWPGEDAIGKRLRLGEKADEIAEVVGIASDGKYATLGERATSYLYQPLLQNHSAEMTLVVRTGSDPQQLIAAVRKQIQSLDQNLPVGPIKTIREQIDAALFTARLGAALPGVFGLLALGLATIGIYGVIAYSVNQRTQEFGIRLALGASSLKLQHLVLREGLTVVLIGVAIGLSLSLAVTRLFAGLLYGISPTDPLTFIGVGLLLTAVAALACYLPARRVAKVDPAVALRQE